MIHRGEFEDKLNKELLKIVHYNLKTSIRLSLFWKDVKVEQSFNSLGSLFQKVAALNIYERCPYVCLILGNFQVPAMQANISFLQKLRKTYEESILNNILPLPLIKQLVSLCWIWWDISHLPAWFSLMGSALLASSTPG